MLVKQRVQITVRSTVVFLAIVASLSFLLATLPVHAAPINNTPNTLKVSPVRTDVEISPGESRTVKMTVTNLTTAPIMVRPVANDFISGDERGTPALILDADKFAPTHSLKRFMQPLSDVTIPANDSKEVEVTIVVPKDAQPGGYFGALRLAPTRPDGGGQVNLNASVASLILMTVPGPAIEKISLTDFAVLQGKKTGSLFQTPDNLQVSFRFQNQGSIQMGPIGQISVKKGGKVVYTVDFNNKPQRDMVLPDSARRWDVPLKNIDSFGHYDVVAVYTYGKNNQTIEVTRSFWVIPVAVMIGAAVGLVVLIGLVVGIVLFLRSYKRRVLSSQGRSGYRRY